MKETGMTATIISHYYVFTKDIAAKIIILCK